MPRYNYDVLQSLWIEYGNHLNWLIPLPGGFHIQYNYQKVVMKAYGDAGLLMLAKAARYRGETLISLSKGKNFRHTHLFLLQTYEAFYNYFLSLYLADSNHLEEGVYVSQINYFNDLKTLLMLMMRRNSEPKYNPNYHNPAMNQWTGL